MRTTTFGYNGKGRLTSVTDALGQTTQFQYDAAGRRTHKILPDGRTVKFGYDAVGNRTSVTSDGPRRIDLPQTYSSTDDLTRSPR